MNNHGVAVVTKSPSTDHAPPIGGAFGRSRPAPPAGCSGSLAGCLPAVTRFASASPRWGACRSGGLASAAPPAPPAVAGSRSAGFPRRPFCASAGGFAVLGRARPPPRPRALRPRCPRPLFRWVLPLGGCCPAGLRALACACAPPLAPRPCGAAGSPLGGAAAGPRRPRRGGRCAAPVARAGCSARCGARGAGSSPALRALLSHGMGTVGRK